MTIITFILFVNSTISYRDFVVDTSMGTGALHTRKEENNISSMSAMNITQPNIPNIVDENLNRLVWTMGHHYQGAGTQVFDM